MIFFSKTQSINFERKKAQVEEKNSFVFGVPTNQGNF